MPRAVAASVYSEPSEDLVYFSASGIPRIILLEALQEKKYFKDLLTKVGARVVLGIDSKGYGMPKNSTDAFIAEVGRMVEDFIPELLD